MQARLRAIATLCSAALIAPASAQVVINRDGSLPPPSVPAEEFAALVDCTVAKRSRDIESYVLARDARFAAALAGGRFPSAEDYDGLVIPMSDGSEVAHERVMVNVIESCRPLKEGYPLGFWPGTLEASWRKALAVKGYESDFDEAGFVRCLAVQRPELLARYASAANDVRKARFAELTDQPVCRARFPAGIRERRVLREARVLHRAPGR